MFGEQIEKMKRDFTDKYVLVDASRPELARFRDVVGRVKTVNMNGRALVEFDEYHLNIGWYDIAPEYLKVVDKPPPKEKKVEAKKAPAPKVAPKKAAGAPASTIVSPAAKAGKPSVAEMLAAARAGGAAKVAGAVPAPTKAKEAPAAASPKVDRSKMSVADMLAAARSGGAAGAAPAVPKAAAPSTAPAIEAEETPAPATPKKAAPAAAKPTEKIDKSKMSIDDIIARCREHDSK